jgi:RNA polymerase sigma factor (TIGR02999 family)
VAGNISQLLVLWGNGEEAALDELMPLVYDELRKLGRSHLNKRRPQALLQPTVLVHEAWMKIAHKNDFTLQNRNQFYALASKVMRDVLVDHLRRQLASKRGGSQIVVPLDDSDPAAPHTDGWDLLVLDAALRRLAQIKERYAQIVDLKFFGGLTTEEMAEALKVSTATIEREWGFARSWLKRELGS